ERENHRTDSRRRARRAARRRAAECRRGAVRRGRGSVGRGWNRPVVARDRSRRRTAHARTAGGNLDGRRIRGGSNRVTESTVEGRETTIAPDLLDAIVAATRRIVEVREAREPLSALAKRAESSSAATGRFLAAVNR